MMKRLLFKPSEFFLRSAILILGRPAQVYRLDALFGSTAISEGQPVSNANKCHLHPRLPFPNRHCAVSAWSPWTGLRIPSLRARYGNVCKLHSVFFLNVLSLGLCSSPAQRLRLGAGVPRHKPPEPALPALPRGFLPRVEVGFRS